MDLGASDREKLQKQRIDSLICISKGIIASGDSGLIEAEFLLKWLQINREEPENSITSSLLNKVAAMLDDGMLGGGDSKELISLLRNTPVQPEQLAAPSNLLFDMPLPSILFPKSTFLFVGSSLFGTRGQCQREIERLGGINVHAVTESLDYLVLGTSVDDAWRQQDFRKDIEKAMRLRFQGAGLSIVSEEHWLSSAGLT